MALRVRLVRSVSWTPAPRKIKCPSDRTRGPLWGGQLRAPAMMPPRTAKEALSAVTQMPAGISGYRSANVGFNNACLRPRKATAQGKATAVCRAITNRNVDGGGLNYSIRRPAPARLLRPERSARALRSHLHLHGLMHLLGRFRRTPLH